MPNYSTGRDYSMNIGVAISQSIRYSSADKKIVFAFNAVVFLLVFAVLVVMAVPAFAAEEGLTPTGCNKLCVNDGYEYGQCSLTGNDLYYGGRTIIQKTGTDRKCQSELNKECYCINTDTKYISENNLALTSVVDTWCKYSVQGGS